jgi:bacteriorhodopsin
MRDAALLTAAVLLLAAMYWARASAWWWAFAGGYVLCCIAFLVPLCRARPQPEVLPRPRLRLVVDNTCVVRSRQ